MRSSGRDDVLREKELKFFVCELAQLRTEHIVDSDVICIPSAMVRCQSEYQCGGVGEGPCGGAAGNGGFGRAATHAR